MEPFKPPEILPPDFNLQRRARIGLAGATGNGKTACSILLAQALWPKGKGVVIDLEQDGASASYKGRTFGGWKIEPFAHIVVAPKDRNHKYILGLLQHLVGQGYEWVVIDSSTTWWSGSLDLVDNCGGKFSNGGREVQAELNQVYEQMHSLELDIVHTFKSHMKWGKKANANPDKEALAPLGDGPRIADDMLYSCDLVFTLARVEDPETGRVVRIDITVTKSRATGALDTGMTLHDVGELVDPILHFLGQGKLRPQTMIRSLIGFFKTVHRLFYSNEDPKKFGTVRVNLVTRGRALSEMPYDELAALHDRISGMAPDSLAAKDLFILPEERPTEGVAAARGA